MMDKELENKRKILELAAKIDPRWENAEVEYNENKKEIANMKKDYIKMLREDIEIALNGIRDAHNGCPDQEWCGSVVEGEPPCEIGSEEWYNRIEDILYIQFEGAYMYLDFLQYQGKIDNEPEIEYDEGFEF